jgi:hypothetical protein
MGLCEKENHTDFNFDPRKPINFGPSKWMITSRQTNMKASYLEINKV